jgi:hypothetical protein
MKLLNTLLRGATIRTASYVLWLGAVALISCGGGEGEPNAPLSQPNRSPSIVSDDEAVFPQTRVGTAYRIVGIDADGDSLTYSVSGDDAGEFILDESSGELSFSTPPDVENPGSADGDNFYFINVSVTDPFAATATKQVIIEVARHDPQGPFLSLDGAVYIAPNTITASDPSTLVSVRFFATTIRNVPDNRVQNTIDTEVRVYDATFENGKRIEMVVNTEITPESEAKWQAERYANILGQLDPIIIEGIESVWIHLGTERMTGPVGGIVIHTGFVENELLPLNALEEVMAHEAIHATIDPLYLASKAWALAQKLDISFISQYARDFPETEDLAESYGAYLAVKNAERNPSAIVQMIEQGIPQRLLFFESIGL